jgi:hypothetical protein
VPYAKGYNNGAEESSRPWFNGDSAEISFLKVTRSKCFDDSNKSGRVVKLKNTGKVVYDTDPFNAT